MYRRTVSYKSKTISRKLNVHIMNSLLVSTGDFLLHCLREL